MNAFLIEAELLLDWFLPRLDVTIADSERGSFPVISCSTNSCRRWRGSAVLAAQPTA
jgi:hypothetical protein